MDRQIEKYKFKSHNITRSNPPHESNYNKYRSTLQKDFGGRCAYCNLSDSQITTPFEIDHFIPRKAFQKERPELENEYSNLIYSCKKCNVAKSSKYKGDIHAANPTNELFYDPAVVDYNTIFYRDRHGAIASDDKKGKEMIQYLKLYRPIHILAWVCEEALKTADLLDEAIKQEKSPERAQQLSDALTIIKDISMRYYRIFIAHYNDDCFCIGDDNGDISI